MRTLLRFGLLVALLHFALSVRAEILIKYAYTDPYGVEKTATAITPAINPHGDLRLALAAGLDRSLRIAFVDGGGTPLTGEATSALLGPGDRIEVAGQWFYGARLALTPPAEDGPHLLRAEILDQTGHVVTVETVRVEIDRTPPTMNGAFGWWAWRPNELYPLPEMTLIGAFEARRFWADGIQDLGAGLDTAAARFQSVYLEGPHAGQVAHDTPAALSEDTVAIGDGGNWDLQLGVHYPAQDGLYSFRFIVFDRAGNVATFGIPLVFDAGVESETLEMFAVFDPDSAANPVPGSPYAGYVPYIPGMTVKTNPVKMLLRVPKANWWQYNPTGISFTRDKPALPPGAFPQTEPDYVDASHIYLEVEFPYVSAASIDPNLGLAPEIRIASLTWWGANYPGSIFPNLVLAPGTDQAPQFVGVQMHWASGDTTVVGHGHDVKKNTPDTVVRIQVTAEPRTYDQVFHPEILPPCVIPAGQTQCSATGAWRLGDTADDMHMHLVDYRLSNQAGDLITPTLYNILIYDGRPPVLESLEFPLVAQQRQAEVLLTEYLTGNWWNLVQVTQVWLEATGGPGSFRLPATRLESTDGVLWWRAIIPLAALPSGVYNLTLYAEDNFGNRSLPLKKTGYVHDATPPVVKIRGEDNALLAGTTIGGLSAINFVVTDAVDAHPVVIFVRLIGGPDNENVAVGFYDDRGIYRIEYPVMPPSVTANDYRIEIEATDASGNTTLAVAPFTFQPGPLRLIAEHGDTIAVPVTVGSGPVRLATGHWPLTTTPVVLHTAGGLPLRGVHDLLVRLSADAAGPLLVEGQTLTPGGEIRRAGYDFSAADSALALPLQWADPAAIAPGYGGQLTVEILYDGAPLFTADLQAWEVGTEVEYRQTAEVYAAKIEEATLSVLPLVPGHCHDQVVTYDPQRGYANSRGLEGDSVCAVQWTTIPASLAPLGGQQARLRGFIDAPGATTTLVYQPGLLVKQQGQHGFYPTGTPVEQTIALTTGIPPVITFSPTGEMTPQVEWLGANAWPTWLGRTNAGTLYGRGDLNYQGLSLIVTDVATGTVVIEQHASDAYARTPLFTELETLEASLTLRVQAYYTRAPELRTEETYRFVALPERALIRLQPPDAGLNTAPLVVQGRFGVYHNRQISYAADRMGEWAVRVYREVHAGEGRMVRYQVGSETTQIAADGSFSVNLGLLAAGPHRLVATASYLGPDVSAPDAVDSTPVGVRIQDGTPIAITVQALRPTARPPFLNILRAIPTHYARGPDVSQVVWERSRDGTTWETIARDPRQARSFGLNETLDATGTYWYRATTHNRYTDATATSAPYAVQAYARPEVTITGPLQTFVGHPVTWTAETPDGPPVVHQWSIARGRYREDTPQVETARQVALAADDIGNWYVTLRSRYADAPDIPDAWTTALRRLKVITPSLSRPKITGEVSVEAGKPYLYSASVAALAGGQGPADLTVSSEWVLPDGSTATGTSLTYTPTAAVEQNLRYRAWVNGYRDTTEVTTTLRLRPWAYSFPNAVFYKQVRREYDPAVVTYTIRLANGTTGGETPGVQWTLPAAATVDQHSDTSVTLSLTTPGHYPLAARVFDTRGHEVLLEDTLSVPEPDPLVASGAIQIGDSWARAPANVTLRWYVDGLLAKERVTGLRLTVNGQVVSETVKSYYTLATEQPGGYDVRFDLETTYGRTVSHSDRFELITGTPPTCAVTPEGDGTTGLQLRANCTAPMGKVLSYQWQVTYADTPATPKDMGQKSASTLRLSADDLARGILAVVLTAVNDKEQASNTARWTP